MIRLSVLAIVIGLTALSCDDDPARSVKIIDRPVATSTATPALHSADAVAVVKPPAATGPSPRPPAKRPVTNVARPPADAGPTVKAQGTAEAPAVADWSPPSCPPPPEDAPGPGSLIVTGPCAFRHDAAVNCSATDDDFIIAITRKAGGSATLVIYLNVEKYHGPGHYEGTQMFVAVQEGSSIYRWSNDNFPITVGPGEEFVELPPTRLDGEPLLIDCSRQIGPSTNYQYQCEGMADAAVIEQTAEVASGRLTCDRRSSEK